MWAFKAKIYIFFWNFTLTSKQFIKKSVKKKDLSEKCLEKNAIKRESLRKSRAMDINLFYRLKTF